jgi:hypothetical protein
LNESGWNEIPYVETEHFQVTKYFLNNYAEQLKRLLSDEDNMVDDDESLEHSQDDVEQ